MNKVKKTLHLLDSCVKKASLTKEDFHSVFVHKATGFYRTLNVRNSLKSTINTHSGLVISEGGIRYFNRSPNWVIVVQQKSRARS